jgi:hypothetical protein
MKKSSSILNKALNEADTIRSSALKNAEDILFQAFSPKFQKMFDSVVEQVGIHDQDPMDGPNPSKLDQDEKESELENPDNAMHNQGEGPELLEQEEESDDEELEEQEEVEDDDIEEQDDDDWEVEEIKEQEDDDEELEEQEEDDEIEEQEDDDEELEEQEEDDEEDVIEIVEQEDDDEELEEQDDDDIEMEEQLEEQEDDDEEIEEQDTPDVNVSKDSKTVTASNEQLKKENKTLKTKIHRLFNENKKLNAGVVSLSKKIKQINLFNAKVACANSVLTSGGIDEDIKVEALKSLDKCKNISEIKVAFDSFRSMLAVSKKKNSTLRESRNINALKNKNMGYKKTEANSADNKMLRLAGITE